MCWAFPLIGMEPESSEATLPSVCIFILQGFDCLVQ